MHKIFIVTLVVNMAIATPNNIGGYDCNTFVDSVPHCLICKICHSPSRASYLSVCCGHLFCKSCLDQYRNTATNSTCPVCRDKKFVTFPNKAVDREIKSLDVYCTNKVLGCEWQGEMNEIKNHLQSISGC